MSISQERGWGAFMASELGRREHAPTQRLTGARDGLLVSPWRRSSETRPSEARARVHSRRAADRRFRADPTAAPTGDSRPATAAMTSRRCAPPGTHPAALVGLEGRKGSRVPGPQHVDALIGFDTVNTIAVRRS